MAFGRQKKNVARGGQSAAHGPVEWSTFWRLVDIRYRRATACLGGRRSGSTPCSGEVRGRAIAPRAGVCDVRLGIMCARKPARDERSRPITPDHGIVDTAYSARIMHRAAHSQLNKFLIALYHTLDHTARYSIVLRVPSAFDSSTRDQTSEQRRFDQSAIRARPGGSSQLPASSDLMLTARRLQYIPARDWLTLLFLLRFCSCQERPKSKCTWAQSLQSPSVQNRKYFF